MAAAWEGSEGRTPLEGLAIVTDPAAGEVAWIPIGLLTDDAVRVELARLVALPGEGGRPVAAHQAKAMMRSLLDVGVDVRCLAIDTAIAAYLLDPAESRYLLDEVLRRYASAELPADGAAPEGQLDLDGSTVSAAQRTGRYALAVDRLIEPLTQALDHQALRALNDEIEVPLVRVLAHMEHAGVGVDADELRGLRDRLNAEVDGLRQQVYDDAGFPIQRQLDPAAAGDPVRQAGADAAEAHQDGLLHRCVVAGEAGRPAPDHRAPAWPTGRSRSCARPTATGCSPRWPTTGGSTPPSTRRSPAPAGCRRTSPTSTTSPCAREIGREFRKAFVPAPGCELLVADYNQIELRCIAHLAQDPGLIESFRSGRDIHTETASRVFGVEPDAVTIEQRSKAKMVSYGLAYGMEAYGLGQRLNIPTEEAALILEAYFEAFPSVKEYMERTVAEARERGYTETLFGRRRQIPELSSPNFRIRQAGERQAMNAGIQGLAADIFKVALVRLTAALEESQMDSQLILQVHDEVLLDVPPAEHDRAADVVVDTMTGAVDLSVPLEVNLAFGPTWADAKG